LRRCGQIAARRFFDVSGLAADRAFSAATAPLTAAAVRTQADLYIAHYPAALPAAAAAARRHGALYAFDAEDFHLGDWPADRAFDGERRCLRAVEARYLVDCAHVTAAAPMIADSYAKAYAIARPTVVLNLFPRLRAPAGPTERGSAAPGPSLYWFSQMIGPGRGIECAVRAIGCARTRPHLYLRGAPAHGFLQELRRIAETVGAADRLHILAPDLPERMERLAACYDLGLCGEPGLTPNNALLLSNKLFTFLVAGVPPILSDTPAQAAMATNIGAADRVYRCDAHDELAAILDRLLDDPRALAQARAETYRLGQERFNWEVERDTLIAVVRRSLSRREGSFDRNQSAHSHGA
jgi:glycosyltransferase involved in cell wall biosynthesis